MPTPRAAIFDMDGTLADSAELAIQSAREGLIAYYARLGLDPVLPPAAAIRAAIGLPSLEYFAALLPSEHRSGAAELRLDVVAGEVRLLASGSGRLFPGALEILAELRRSGWRLGLVSNCGRRYFDANLQHLGLGSALEVAFCLDDGPTKAANVREALRRLDAGRGVMVGDRAADMEAGRAAGLVTVACRYGFGTPAELAGADHAIDAISELPALLARIG